jgi:hypothetical protein
MRYAPPAALAVAAAAAAVMIPAAVSAHFILVEPNGWLVENQLGDPQKLGPCGGTSKDPGTPTNIVNMARGGDMMKLRVKETIYHPGHYRVSLAVKDRSELPADPDIMLRDTPKGPYSVSAKIAEAKPPIIADGLFVHTERPKPGEIFETSIRLPNINCDKCVIQIAEFMAEHPRNADGDFTYHHCATFNIVANPKLPIDKGWPGQDMAKGKKAKKG